MWIINFIPDFVIHLAALLGFAALIVTVFFDRFIPILYRVPFELGTVAVLVIALFLEGANYDNQAWMERVREMEAKVAAAEAKSETANAAVETRVVTKIQYIKDTTNANQTYLQGTVAKDLNASCQLTAASVVLHDSASQNEVSGSTPIANGTTTEVKASQLLSTVVDNYGICYEYREKLLGWQEWYTTQKKIYEEVK